MVPVGSWGPFRLEAVASSAALDRLIPECTDLQREGPGRPDPDKQNQNLFWEHLFPEEYFGGLRAPQVPLGGVIGGLVRRAGAQEGRFMSLTATAATGHWKVPGSEPRSCNPVASFAPWDLLGWVT